MRAFSEYYARNADRIKSQKKEYQQRIKVEVLSNYGGCCAVCGITDPAFLTIDHVNGGGKQQRTKNHSVRSVYSFLRRNGFPLGFQILCWNHNWLKYVEERRLTVLNSNHAKSDRSTIRKRKEKVISQYGGRCTCCGETNIDLLTIDHINNDGAEHRRKIGGSVWVYRWLIRNNFPTDFQVLCWNHNSSRLCPSLTEMGVV